MGEAAGVMSLLGTGVQVGGQVAGGYSQANAMRGQAQAARSISNQNAALDELQAQDALLRGDQAIARHGMSTRALIGAQRASAAGQGVSVNSGTPAALVADTGRLSAMDDATLRMNAYKEATGQRMEAANQRFRGNMMYRAGQNNANNTLLAAGFGASRSVYGGLEDYYRYTPPMRVPTRPVYDGLDTAQNWLSGGFP